MTEGFGYWLAGLIDGEGSFQITCWQDRRGWTQRRVFFALDLRADDRPMLETIIEETGLGRIEVRNDQRPNHNPICKWIVVRRDECVRLAELLDRYPLRSKKRRDFETWREALPSGLTIPELREIMERLRAGRAFEVVAA
jgi:hypothetical protein